MEFTPTEPPGAYRIKGIASNLYLSMDSKGKLYGEADRSNGATVFAEHSQVNNFKFIWISWMGNLMFNFEKKIDKQTCRNFLKNCQNNEQLLFFYKPSKTTVLKNAKK